MDAITNHLKRIIAIAIVALAWVTDGQAQQDPMYTHYMFNTLSVNSGYAGSRECFSANFLTRHQWVGYGGGPTTQTLSLHGPFKTHKVALGGTLVHDVLGPMKQTGLFTDFVYRMKVSNEARIAFGLKGGFNVMQANLTDLKTVDGNDLLLQQNINGLFLPNFGFGVYYHAYRYYIGLAAPRLLENKLARNNALLQVGDERRHYFFIAGAVLDVSRNVRFRPSFLTKVVYGAPVEFDVSGSFLFDDRVWLGAAYRLGDALSVLLQYEIDPQWSIGYAHDFTVTALRSYHGGTHEFMLRYDLRKRTKHKIRSPRFF